MKIKKAMTTASLALALAGVGSVTAATVASTTANAKTVCLSDTYHQNIFTGQDTNFQYYWADVPSWAYLSHMSEYNTIGGWNFWVIHQNYYWNW